MRLWELSFISIIKSEVLIIGQCLWLCNETTAHVVCLAILFCKMVFVISWLIPRFAISIYQITVKGSQRIAELLATQRYFLFPRCFSHTLTLSMCTLAGPVYTGIPLECHWLTQYTLGYHWATQQILAGYTGTPLEKLSWNSLTLECHWRNLFETAQHWDATGETLTFAAYTGTPLEGLWQPTHTPTHIVKHAE